MEPNQQSTNSSVPEPMMPPAPSPEVAPLAPPTAPEASMPPLPEEPTAPTAPPVSADPMATQPMVETTPIPVAMPASSSTPKAKKGLPKGAMIVAVVVVIFVILLVILAFNK